MTLYLGEGKHPPRSLTSCLMKGEHWTGVIFPRPNHKEPTEKEFSGSFIADPFKDNTRNLIPVPACPGTCCGTSLRGGGGCLTQLVTGKSSAPSVPPNVSPPPGELFATQKWAEKKPPNGLFGGGNMPKSCPSGAESRRQLLTLKRFLDYSANGCLGGLDPSCWGSDG